MDGKPTNDSFIPVENPVDNIHAGSDQRNMSNLARIESGAWQHDPLFEDYRAEWLTDVLVERATWQEDAPVRKVSGAQKAQTIVAPHYVWARFWFRREGWIVEKYFSATARPLGFYAPICGPIDYHGGKLRADLYGLALWIDAAGRVTVLGEEAFDRDVETGEITPVALEHAEHRIRELTTLTAQKRFPPAFVRNFGIVLD